MAAEWPAMAAEAAKSDASFADFLERLLNAETDAKAERQRQTLLKLATLPTIKTLAMTARGMSDTPAAACDKIGVDDRRSAIFAPLHKAKSCAGRR